jgi:hypothetical protein
MPHNKHIQSRIDAFVLNCKGLHNYDKDQIIAFVMMEFNLMYNDAKRMTENSLKGIESS